MPSNLLLLAPLDPFAAPDRDDLIARLREARFIGDPLPEEGFHKPGEQFFHHMTFLGCSPVVSLGEPGITAEVCLVEIPPFDREPRFMAGDNVKAPRCPGCGVEIDAWRAVVEAWRGDPHGYHWHCPRCGHEYEAPALDWRHCAGFGRASVRVWGIFEGEAVPGEPLLSLLWESGSDWGHFYLRLPSPGQE